ncbi:hypothetical protein PRIC1_014331 [Phytophthora ramorum]
MDIQLLASLLITDTMILSFSGFIPPSEVELGEICKPGNVGSDFRAKWLDADAVVKLFIPDASHSTFEREVRVWQQLRHPNVLKLYGVCQAASDVNFFVCEYASQGSLIEYVNTSYSLGESKPPLMWKYLHEAALGLEYLHERGIAHGDLRCSNILIGSDGVAKLSNFGLTGSMKEWNSVGVVGSMHWQSPEVLEGDPPSRESDVYSLGMCILEAESGKKPWSKMDVLWIRNWKLKWNVDAHTSVPYDEDDSFNPGAKFTFVKSADPYYVRRSREFVWRMCCQGPHERPSLPSIISKLEHLAIEESSDGLESACSIDDYLSGQMKEQWLKLQTCMNECDNVQHRQIFDKLMYAYDRLRESKQNERLLDQFCSLLNDAYLTVTMTPEQARMLRLTSARATTTSIYSFNWRFSALLKGMGESTSEETKTSWQQQHRDQAAAFVSGVTDAVLLSQGLKSVEEKAAFLQMLNVEMESPQDKYTNEQLDVMKKTYEEMESRLKLEVEGDVANLTPEWFIPWYELLLDKGKHLGTGSFGCVFRAKWLDSDVVVKQVLLPGSGGNSEDANDFDSVCGPIDQTPIDRQTAAERRETKTMFRREADIWFGFSHPHVVRLFGACHIGSPFFVCEYATHGTLDKYLRKRPDELWTKLWEAALGVQYLHARGVVHGDLKGNNIVIGSDLKAKVTDFGLSSLADGQDISLISCALHWVAPECLVDKKGEKARIKTTFKSDVYSFGMCIVEALRVVEAVGAGKPSYGCVPWGDNAAVKYNVTHGKLPPRPKCEDGQWGLIERMCSAKPEERIKISTVVAELERLANDTNTQPDHVTDRTDSANQGSVALVTAAARKLLTEWRSSTEEHNISLALSYDSLWEHINYVREQMAGGGHAAAYWSAFHSLAVEARASTANLKSVRRDLISLTQATMKCYALRRRLDKLCDVALVCRAK